MLEQLRKAGLQAEIRNTSAVSYLPLDQTLGVSLLVEDEAEASRLVAELIQAGIPVENLAE